MKKLVSIAFILLLLFNVLGYYGLFFGLHYQNKQQLIQQFDTEDYSDLETVTIKMPLAVPYANDAQEYQRVDGEFEHNGEFYRMVKQRLSQDTLYIVCIKDQQSKRINQALTDYVKTFSDKPVDGKSHSLTLPTFTKEYLVSTYTIKSSSKGWSFDVSSNHTPVVLIHTYCSSIIHPPERA